MMPLFTFVADYKGGTYVSQVRAASLRAAQKTWARKLQPDAITGFGKASHKRLIEFVESSADTKAVPLNDLENAWCFSVHGFLVNVVSTNQN